MVGEVAFEADVVGIEAGGCGSACNVINNAYRSKQWRRHHLLVVGVPALIDTMGEITIGFLAVPVATDALLPGVGKFIHHVGNQALPVSEAYMDANQVVGPVAPVHARQVLEGMAQVESSYSFWEPACEPELIAAQ